MACRQRDELRAPAIEIRISTNEQRAGPTLDRGSERCVDFVFGTCNQHFHPQPKRLGSAPRFGLYGLRRRTFRVHQNSNRVGTRHDLMQKFKALCDEACIEIAQSGEIAARLVQTEIRPPVIANSRKP
jgi:hypothetical protein